MLVKLVALAAGLVGLVPAPAHGAGGHAAQRSPSLAQAERLAGRIDEARPRAERLGVYVALTTVERRRGSWCSVVRLLNPTLPNRRWLRKEFGPGACPSAQPMSTLGRNHNICPSGSGAVVAVPQVVGLSAFEAARRLKAVGLSIGCVAGEYDRPPSRYSFMNFVAVERMCEGVGRAGGSVDLRLVGTLPGGFRFVARECA